MKYANPTPPEGINSGGYRPMREFVVLVGVLLVVTGALLTVVYQFSQWVVPFVPFSWERQAEAPFVGAFAAGGEGMEPTQVALQALADRLASHMDLPEDITIQVHYAADPAINAMATIGGNIVVFEGLLKHVPSEDALALVLAHEIAHVKHRDVLAALGGNAIVSVVASVLLGDTGSVGRVIGLETSLTMLHYSRAKETRADQDAFHALTAVYGHGGGARDLFEVLSTAEREAGVAGQSEMMRSHPLTEKRLRALEVLARELHWPMDGARSPLAGALGAR